MVSRSTYHVHKLIQLLSKMADIKEKPPLPQEVVQWRRAARDVWSLEDPEVSEAQRAGGGNSGLPTNCWVEKRHGAVTFGSAHI